MPSRFPLFCHSDAVGFLGDKGHDAVTGDGAIGIGWPPRLRLCSRRYFADWRDLNQKQCLSRNLAEWGLPPERLR